MKWLVAVLCSLFTVSLSFGQDLKYEVIRTAESPGYFALRVYPGSNMPPLAVQTVLVENYTSKTERHRYTPLTQALRRSGTLVLSAQQAVGYVNDDRFRLVLLGGPKQERWLQFRSPVGTEPTTAFQNFSQAHLGPVYLMNLKADFGGNTHQVRPDQVPFLNDQATYFVGQFERPIKTRVTLNGETNDSLVQADGVMDLTTFTPHQASSVLPQLWQDLSASSRRDNWRGLKNLVTNAFPLIPIGLGALLIWLSARPSRLRTGMIDEINDEFWHTPIEETPLYTTWEKGFTWELSDAELRKF